MQGLVAILMDSRFVFRIVLFYCVLSFILCLKIERMLIMMTVGEKKNKKIENRKVINSNKLNLLFIYVWINFSLLTFDCASG